jgi:hypothetical protein
MKKDDKNQEQKGFLISPSPHNPGFVVAVKAKNVPEAAIMIINLQNTGFPKSGDVDVYAVLVWEYCILGRIGKKLYTDSVSDGYGRKLPDDFDINKISKKGTQPFLVRLSVAYEQSDDNLKITIVAE